jgi:hypothetical protein
MPEKKTADQPKPEPAPPPVLGVAAESTNPDVHQLLAHREIAILNGDEETVKATTAHLAELGVK